MNVHENEKTVKPQISIHIHLQKKAHNETPTKTPIPIGKAVSDPKPMKGM